MLNQRFFNLRPWLLWIALLGASEHRYRRVHAEELSSVCPDEKPEMGSPCVTQGIAPGTRCDYEYRDTSCDEITENCNPTEYYSCSESDEWMVAMPSFVCPNFEFPFDFLHECVPAVKEPGLPCPETRPDPNTPCDGHDPGLRCEYEFTACAGDGDEWLCTPTYYYECDEDSGEWFAAVADKFCPDLEPCDPSGLRSVCPREQPEWNTPCNEFVPGLQCIYGYGNSACTEGVVQCTPQYFYECVEGDNEWSAAIADYFCDGFNFPPTFMDECNPCPAVKPAPGDACTDTFHVGYECDYEYKTVGCGDEFPLCAPTELYTCSEDGWFLASTPRFGCPGGNPDGFFADCDPNGGDDDGSSPDLPYDKVGCQPGPHDVPETDGDFGNAPDVYYAYFPTTVSDVPLVIEVNRTWAPIGADRFFALMMDRFYDCSALYRVIPGFVVQWGIASEPDETAKWNTNLPDDPAGVVSNTAGTISYATAGADTRTTQVFVNLADNAYLDAQGFAPFGRVVSGMEEVLLSGDLTVPDPEPNQVAYTNQGNSWILNRYPEIDIIKESTEVLPFWEGGDAGEDEMGTGAPVVEEPVVEEPVVELPVVELPAIEEPAVEEPAVEEPAVEEPAVEAPAVEEPAVEAPAVEEPAVEEPATAEGVDGGKNLANDGSPIVVGPIPESGANTLAAGTSGVKILTLVAASILWCFMVE